MIRDFSWQDPAGSDNDTGLATRCLQELQQLVAGKLRLQDVLMEEEDIRAVVAMTSSPRLERIFRDCETIRTHHNVWHERLGFETTPNMCAVRRARSILHSGDSALVVVLLLVLLLLRLERRGRRRQQQQLLLLVLVLILVLVLLSFTTSQPSLPTKLTTPGLAADAH